MIQTNKYFSQESWNSKISNTLTSNELKRFEFNFCENILNSTSLLEDSNVCFSILFPNYEMFKHLELLYIGISDIDNFNKYKVDNNFKLFTSKGLATNIISEHAFTLAI